jgi:hypothetical protein
VIRRRRRRYPGAAVGAGPGTMAAAAPSGTHDSAGQKAAQAGPAGRICQTETALLAEQPPPPPPPPPPPAGRTPAPSRSPAGGRCCGARPLPGVGHAPVRENRPCAAGDLCAAATAAEAEAAAVAVGVEATCLSAGRLCRAHNERCTAPRRRRALPRPPARRRSHAAAARRRGAAQVAKLLRLTCRVRLRCAAHCRGAGSRASWGTSPQRSRLWPAMLAPRGGGSGGGGGRLARSAAGVGQSGGSRFARGHPGWDVSKRPVRLGRCGVALGGSGPGHAYCDYIVSSHSKPRSRANAAVSSELNLPALCPVLEIP